MYRSLQTTEKQNPQKASRGLPGPVCQKVSKKSLKDPKKSQEYVKISVQGLFDTFLTLRAGSPGNTFSRLFEDFWVRGSGDSCMYMAVLIVKLSHVKTHSFLEKFSERLRKLVANQEGGVISAQVVGAFFEILGGLFCDPFWAVGRWLQSWKQSWKWLPGTLQPRGPRGLGFRP